ncbi:MAG: MFS transporter [Devosia sp.]
MTFGLQLRPEHRVFGAFAIYSFTMGNIFPRLPDIQHAMQVQEGALGLGLIGAPVGTLLALTFATPLLERIGFRRALLALIPVMSVFYAVASFAPNPLVFFFLLFPVGLAIGCIEIILNLEADRTEHLVGHRIMNRAHAFWSLGFFGAGAVSAFIAQSGLSPQQHLMLMVPVAIIGTALILGRFEPAAHRSGGNTDKTARFAAPTTGIFVLFVVVFSAVLMEGAGIDWSANYMKTIFEASPFIASVAVATGALAQGITRFFADGFVERYSPKSVARVLLTILGAGTVLVYFANQDWMALLGFALIGVGSSALFPLAMSAAAQRTDRPAAVNVAAFAQIAFGTFMLGPPLLGFVAEHWGIRWSFGIGLPLVILSLIFAGALGKKPIPHEVD